MYTKVFRNITSRIQWAFLEGVMNARDSQTKCRVHPPRLTDQVGWGQQHVM